MRKLRMLLTLLLVSVCSWQGAWAQEVKVSVSLPEPNSLATEILAKQGIDDVKTVTELTVTSGTLGELDWTTLQNMTALKTLDLSGTSNKAIPDNQFDTYYSKAKDLETVKLPSGLETIGNSAFNGCQKLVMVNVPSTVKTIGGSAFRNCNSLLNCSLANLDITEIPDNCFSYCSNLLSFDIPSTVTSIGSYAFAGCEAFTSNLPANIAYIGSHAFDGAAMTDLDIIIPEGIEINWVGAFQNTGIKSITLPSNCNELNNYVYYCENLTDITFKSPTVVVADSYYFPNNIENITLHVPSYLINFYLAHKDWSNFKTAVAIDPAVKNFTVKDDLVLNYAMRMESEPNVTFSIHDNNNSSFKTLLFKITGDASQVFNNFTAEANISSGYYYFKDRYWTMIMSECPNVSVNEDFTQRVYTYKNRWRFMCLPFDFKVGEVTTEEGQFAIRTYNGARRNEYNESSTGENWTNREGNDVIEAGTGFIFQTSHTTWTTFKALSGETNFAFNTSSETDIPTIPLAANNANSDAAPSNKGWNMVGNPWLTFYNAHKINYTAPFCYYNEYYGAYETVSIQDDDFALPPLTAIFVQCPDGISSIGFPGSGRQLTDEITDQNGARAFEASSRQLLDIQVAGSEELKDKTRLVLNPEAKAGYEIGRDISKFFSSETKCPQIYSLGADGTQYAINELPEASGIQSLGIVFASDGQYTISAIRNNIGQVILTDNETGIKTDLETNDYSFEAKQGSCEGRFTLTFNDVTGIQTIKKANTDEMQVFKLDGQKAGNSTNGLKKGVYVVRQGQKTQKVIIK